MSNTERADVTVEALDPSSATRQEFVEGFAAGAELDRATAWNAWLRWSDFSASTENKNLTAAEYRDLQERGGRTVGFKLGRRYLGRPESAEPMTTEQHNRFPKGRWTR